MKLPITCLRMTALLLWCTGIASGASRPQALLNVLPDEKALGVEWKRGITVLFDPLSNPPEIVRTASNLPDSFRKQKRAGVEDPNSTVSGWTHTHYTFQATNGSFVYDVQVERYRKPDRLQADFDHLLTLQSDDYQKSPVTGVGDAAVFYRVTKGAGSTLWFRRADFKVWISPIGSGSLTNWEADAPLRRLARALDERIFRAVQRPGFRRHGLDTDTNQPSRSGADSFPPMSQHKGLNSSTPGFRNPVWEDRCISVCSVIPLGMALSVDG